MSPPTPTDQSSLRGFVGGLPKAELHVHIEGTLEPGLTFELAARNGIALPYPSIDALRQACAFTDLQSFLDLYYAAAGVLVAERDFYDMTMAYLQRAHADTVRHVEIMFDPQTHTARGIGMETVFAGMARALREMREKTGMTGYLLLSFLRHLSEEDGFATLRAALPLRAQYRDIWIGVGLDSSERGNPPRKFARLFAHCKELGFRRVAHAGEEGPAAYVRDALDVLQVERIDHGVRSEDDPVLMRRLIDSRVPLTVCPLSNLRLGVVDDLARHNLARMLRQGAMVTVNSDDPAYFGGYISDNYLAAAQALDLTRAELGVLTRNSLLACFLPDSRKMKLLRELDAYLDPARAEANETDRAGPA